MCVASEASVDQALMIARCCVFSLQRDCCRRHFPRIQEGRKRIQRVFIAPRDQSNRRLVAATAASQVRQIGQWLLPNGVLRHCSLVPLRKGLASRAPVNPNIQPGGRGIAAPRPAVVVACVD